MLVHADSEREVDAGGAVAAIRKLLGAVAPMPAGLERHAALVKAFIDAAGLVQGVADGEFGSSDRDAPSPRQEAGMRLLLDLARCIDLSWRTGFSDGSLDLRSGELDLLASAGAIKVRLAEGHAFYALYPESYLLSARRSGLGRRTVVIGIRSIGTGLSAIVASALGASPPVTVRPVGHPFDRRIEASPELAAGILAARPHAFAIVDEGPGLSGSSFAAVAKWLEQCGAQRSRIHFFPSHGGLPGPHASAEIRARWQSTPRHHAGFEETIIDNPDPALRLERWVARLTGPLQAPPQEISGGGWREFRPCSGGGLPPADPRMERRKFLARTQAGTFHVKFAGLGAEGARKLATARKLAAAGHAPEPLGLAHGFLVERWIEKPSLADSRLPRGKLVEGIAAYLRFRRDHLPAFEQGASLQALAEMTRRNVSEALGCESARRLEPALSRAAVLESRVRAVDTDNRMHAWEWLAGLDGRLVKTDALDHSGAHDLVGCQDIAWDVAGAIVEHGLSGKEAERLMLLSGGEGGPVDAELTRFLLPCYLAFQLGLWTLTASANDGDDAAHAQRTAVRYATYLEGMPPQP